MSHRVINGLLFAREYPGQPHRQSRGRGAKAKGLRYERALAKALPLARHGQWFSFGDKNGHGFCQPDFIIETPAEIVVLESKYTWTLAGHDQIEELYRPVLEFVYRKPVIGVVVCKNLVSGMRGTRVEASLTKAVFGLRAGDRSRAVVQWLGKSALEVEGLGPQGGRASVRPLSALSPRANLASAKELGL